MFVIFLEFFGDDDLFDFLLLVVQCWEIEFKVMWVNFVFENEGFFVIFEEGNVINGFDFVDFIYVELCEFVFNEVLLFVNFVICWYLVVVNFKVVVDVGEEIDLCDVFFCVEEVIEMWFKNWFQDVVVYWFKVNLICK